MTAGKSKQMHYRGNCVYDMPFEVSIPGLYHLNLVWNRENYVGAKEGTQGWLKGEISARSANLQHDCVKCSQI